MGRSGSVAQSSSTQLCKAARLTIGKAGGAHVAFGVMFGVGFGVGVVCKPSRTSTCKPAAGIVLVVGTYGPHEHATHDDRRHVACDPTVTADKHATDGRQPATDAGRHATESYRWPRYRWPRLVVCGLGAVAHPIFT